MITYRDMKNIILVTLNHEAANTQWHTINNNVDLSDRMHALNSSILLLLNKHAPTKRTRVTGLPSHWITPDIMTLMAERDLAHRNFKKANE